MDTCTKPSSGGGGAPGAALKRRCSRRSCTNVKVQGFWCRVSGALDGHVHEAALGRRRRAGRGVEAALLAQELLQRCEIRVLVEGFWART